MDDIDTENSHKVMDIKLVDKFINSYSLSKGDEDKLTKIETDLIEEYNKIKALRWNLRRRS